MREDLAVKNQWTVLPDEGEVFMVNTSLSSKVLGYCNVSLELLGEYYTYVRLRVLSDLCGDIIPGHDFLNGF